MQGNTGIYNNGEYLRHNPTWHVEDSFWKASNILKLIYRNHLSLNSVCEIGCGAGEILNQLHKDMGENVLFTGYEISEGAYKMSITRAKDRLIFKFGDLLDKGNHEFYDLLLVIDIFEHVEDYFTFLRKSKEKAKYKVFHIPLDISVQTVLRASPFLINRENVGHIHYFNKEIALAVLKDLGFEVIDYFYTHTATELPTKTFKSKLAKWPRNILFKLDQDITVRILGGYSLMVLTK